MTSLQSHPQLEERDKCTVPGCHCTFFDSERADRCWCGHEHSQHDPPPRNPPPRGGILGRCRGYVAPSMRFNANSICANPGCGQSYICHGRIVQSSTAASYASVVASGAPADPVLAISASPNAQNMPIIASSTSAVTSWQPSTGPAVNGTANDRRREHAQQTFSTNPAFQPTHLPSSQRHSRQRGANPQAHNPFPGPNNGFRNAPVIAPNVQPQPSLSASSAPGNVLRTYKVALLPYGPKDVTSYDNIDHDLGRNLKSNAPRVFPIKLSDLIARLDEHGLVLEVTFQAALHESIFTQFHNALVQQCTSKSFTINSRSYSLTQDIPNMSKSLFRLLKGGNNVGNGQKLNDAKIEHYDFTPSNLGKVAAAIRNPDSGTPLLFFAPKCRLNGPITMSSTSAHPCFAERVMHGFLTPDLDEHDGTHVECYNECPQEVGTTSASSSPLFHPDGDLGYNFLTPNDDNDYEPDLPPVSSFSTWDGTPDHRRSHRLSLSSASSAQRQNQTPEPVDPATPPPATPFIDLTSAGTGDALSTFAMSGLRGPAPFRRESSPLEVQIASHEMQSLLFESGRGAAALSPAHPEPVPTPQPSSPNRATTPEPNVISDDDDDDQESTRSGAGGPRDSASASNSTIPMDLQTFTLSRWEMEMLRLNQPRRILRALNLEAPTEKIAAEALFKKLLSHYKGIELPLPEGAIISDWDFSNLALGVRNMKIGRGVGPGVIRSVLTQAIDDGLTNSSLWRPIGEGGLLTWELLTNRRNAHRQAVAKVYATLCALHITWFQSIPSNVSPWMIALAIHWDEGSNLPPLPQIFTHDLLQSYDPALADELANWPLSPSLTTDLSPGSPCGTLIAAHLDIQPSTLNNARSDPDLWADFTQALYCKVLFGTNHDLEGCHDLAAFIKGFNIPISSSVKLVESLGDRRRARHLFGLMSTLRLRSADQVSSRIELIIADNSLTLLGTDTTPANSRAFSPELQRKFRDRFSRYLRGLGHPPPTSPYADLITEAMRQSPGAADPLFRAKMLLRLSTGSAFIPQTPGWRLKIRFISPLPARRPPRASLQAVHAGNASPALSVQDVNPVMAFHSCASEIHVPTTSILISALEGAMPTNDAEFTAFDRLMHSAIMSLDGTNGGDGFNIL